MPATTPRPRPHDADVRLTLPARAENIALVRHVVGALAEAIGMPQRLLDDIRLALTEACTNVVRHAYRGDEGPLEVAVLPDGDTLTIVVRDHGQGIDSRPSSDGPGLGLPLMAALAEELEIEQEPGNGSAVRMRFRADRGTLQAA